MSQVEPSVQHQQLASSTVPPEPVSWPPGKTAAACLTFDMDAEAGVLGEYRIRFYTEPTERDEIRVLVEATDPAVVRTIEERIFGRLALRVRVVPVMPGVLAAQRLKARRVEDMRQR